MKGIFVNEDGGIRYAQAIVQGYKPIETRSRNMLSGLVGERVAIIRTRKGKSPMVVGYADITRWEFCPWTLFEMYRDQTLIPSGSRYDISGKGKYFYHMANPETCEPYALPSSAIRHGRSWAEWNDATDALSWSEAVADAMTEDDWNHLHDGEDQMRELF